MLWFAVLILLILSCFCWVLNVLFVLIHIPKIFTVLLSGSLQFPSRNNLRKGVKRSTKHKQTESFVCFKTHSIIQLSLRDVASFFLLSLNFIVFCIQEVDIVPCGSLLLPQSVLYSGDLKDTNRCSSKEIYCFTLVWEACAYIT